MKLIDNAGREFHRLWVIRASLGFGAFTGVSCVLAVAGADLNPWLLVGLSVFVNVALIPLARLAKQDTSA